MKLLLTSAGITNASLKKTLKELVGEDIKTAFIPTAANFDDEDKSWLVKNYVEFQKIGYLDIVDVSALPKDNWLKRLKKANVIAIGGGNANHLMKKIIESGLDKELPNLLEKKVYVGLSSGAIITGKKLWFDSESMYGFEIGESPKGLGFTNINFRSHLNDSYFPNMQENVLEKISKENPNEKIYALDDDSGLKIIDGKIVVISEGEWKLFEN